jgi:8-oxo-dGTP pyrophosphatase MutT (NUDIX family)
MGLDLLADDGRDHEYCWQCHAESVDRVEDAESVRFRCRTCGALEDRSYFVPAAYVRWIADDGTYWHESAGVFVRDQQGRFLFFQRRIWPRLLTVPAGHVEIGETGIEAARRELREETGLAGDELEHLADFDVVNDACSAGAASHRWHAFRLLTARQDLQLSHEGVGFVWLTLDEVLDQGVISPVQETIERLRDRLERDPAASA